MHLGEGGSRNRTKATMRIMNLMLSLSPATSSAPVADHGNVPQKGILFHSAFAETTAASSPSITAGSSSTSGGGTSFNLNQTQATVAVPTAKNTADKATAEPHVFTQTQSQTSTINNPSSSHISISSGPSTVAHAAATSSPPKATIPVTTVATADSGGTSVGFPTTVKVQSTEADVASTNSRTEPSVIPTTSPYHAETSNTPTHPTTEQTHAAITKTSEGDTKKTTVPVTTNFRTTETGKPGTTSTPPTLTTGSTVPENLSETTLLQTSTAATTDPLPKIFLYSLNSRPEKENNDNELVEMCKRLMANMQDGNCTLIWRHKNGKVQIDCMEINGKVKTSIITQYYEEISKKPPDNKTLIAILASCGALLIMIFILAICASHHRRSYNENQQHLTEELHTVENGYHDNPTLEVMEVQPEMQEKKVALNGEFNNDSWIVPIDNLLKEDILDEEDTHL